MACAGAVDEEKQRLVSDPSLEFMHGYPPTKIMFTPESGVNAFHKDLLVTTADYLRIFEIKNGRTHQVATLHNVRTPSATLSILGSGL